MDDITLAILVALPLGAIFAVTLPPLISSLKRRRWEHGLYIDDEYYVYGYSLALAIDDIVEDSSLLSAKPYLQDLVKLPRLTIPSDAKPTICRKCGCSISEHYGRKLVKIQGVLMHEDCVNKCEEGVIPYYSDSKIRFARIKNLYHLKRFEGGEVPGIVLARVVNYEVGFLANALVVENEKPPSISIPIGEITASFWLMFFIALDGEFVLILKPSTIEELKQRLPFAEPSESAKSFLREKALLKDNINVNLSKKLTLNEIAHWIEDVKTFLART